MGIIQNFQLPPPKTTRRRFLKTSSLTAAAIIVHGCQVGSQPLIEVFPHPKTFSRRYGELSVNIGGQSSSEVTSALYSFNSGQWHPLPQGRPRVPPPLFNIELPHEELIPGDNTIVIQAKSEDGEVETVVTQFHYDPSPIQLPILLSWEKGAELDVQDGAWETFQDEKGWRVRPKPGFEEYDRILNLTGSFAGGRRIETDLIFRRDLGWRKWRKELRGDHGYGVLSMWGGHVEDESVRPKRGWHYGLGWFWEHNGLGLEFAENRHQEEWQKSFSYRDFTPKANTQYFIILECWPEADESGQHQYYRQRMKWWTEDEAVPNTWIEIDDIEPETGIPTGQSHINQLDIMLKHEL
jgi:hypothetical protein